MIDFRMPSLGADMEDGTLVEWLIQPGQQVTRGQVVAVVETQKGAIEIEVFNDGVVTELLVPVGSQVPVGTVMARIGGAGDTTPPATPAPPPSAPSAPVTATRTEAPRTEAPPAEPPPDAPPRAEAPRTPSPPSRPPAPPPDRIRISPVARRAARARGIDPATLTGHGVGGAITLADVEAAMPTASPVVDAPTASATPPRRRTGFDPAAMRQAIAAAMSRSKREIPHYYLTQTMDVSAALAWMERWNADRPPTERLLPAALFLRAIALAVAKAPALNGFWERGAFQPGDGVHVGWAVALRGGGLVAPAIADADKRSLPALMAAMRDLVQRARASGLRGSELNTATITVTSLGDRGAESVLPIIYPPQVAMIGIGRVVTRPWVVDTAVVPRSVVTFTLAGDHRASDGHHASLMLAEIERLLREPDAL